MRAAPPVLVQLGSGRREQFVLAVIWGAAALVLLVWIALRAAWSPGLMIGLAALLAASAAAGIAWQIATPMQGELAWDGQAWSLRAPGANAWQRLPQLHLALDLGGWVLLRGARGRWCAVSLQQGGANWHGLQVALRNPTPPPAPTTRPEPGA